MLTIYLLNKYYKLAIVSYVISEHQLLLISSLFIAVKNFYTFQIQNVCFKHYYNTMLYKHIKLTVVINISVPIVETNTSDSR